MTERIYLRAKSELAVRELTDWKEKWVAASKVWIDYCRLIGADTYLQFMSHEAPTVFSFKTNDPPPLWTKPGGRHKSAVPQKKNKVAQAELAALPMARATQELAQIFKLPSHFTYDQGISCLGSAFETWRVSWTDLDIFLVGPDPRPTIGNYANVKFDIGDGSLPLEDFDLLSLARYDFLFAEAAVRLEERP